MATTGVVSAPSSLAAGTTRDTPPAVVGFSPSPRTYPVNPAGILRVALLALVVANLGRIPLLSFRGHDASIVLNDVFVCALAGLGAVAATVRRSLRIDSVAFAALVFAVVGLVSAILAVPRFGLTPIELTISLAYLARWLVYFAIYLYVVNNIRSDSVNAVVGSMEAVILAITAFGVFQSIFLPNFAHMVYSTAGDTVGWDDQGNRLVSTVLEPNIVASMIVVMLLVMLARVSLGVRTPWWRPAFLLLGLAMTISRSGVLALLIGTLVILAARGLSVRLIRFFAALAVLTLAALPRLVWFAAAYGKFSVGKNSSAGVRLYAWIVALNTFLAHPVIGVGFNTYGYFKQHMGMRLATASTYSSEGGLLFVAVMTGTVGLIAYVGMLWLVMRRCRHIWRDLTIAPEHRAIAIGAAAGLCAILVHSLFVNSIFTTFVMEMLWVLWGLTFVIAAERNRTVERVAM